MSIKKFDYFKEDISNEVPISFVLRKIRDRIINNVQIVENANSDPELDIEDCMRIIADDLKDYTITINYI